MTETQINPKEIAAYKQKLGLTTGVTNTLICWEWTFSDAVWHSDASNKPWYVISFEDNDIVLIKIYFMSVLGQATKIPKQAITRVKVSHGWLLKRIRIDYQLNQQPHTLPLQTGKIIIGNPHQKANFNNLDNLIQKYNQ